MGIRYTSFPDQIFALLRFQVENIYNKIHPDVSFTNTPIHLFNTPNVLLYFVLKRLDGEEEQAFNSRVSVLASFLGTSFILI